MSLNHVNETWVYVGLRTLGGMSGMLFGKDLELLNS